jgi:hypothetical protein
MIVAIHCFLFKLTRFLLEKFLYQNMQKSAILFWNVQKEPMTSIGKQKGISSFEMEEFV